MSGNGTTVAVSNHTLNTTEKAAQSLQYTAGKNQSQGHPMSRRKAERDVLRGKGELPEKFAPDGSDYPSRSNRQSKPRGKDLENLRREAVLNAIKNGNVDELISSANENIRSELEALKQEVLQQEAAKREAECCRTVYRGGVEVTRYGATKLGPGKCNDDSGNRWICPSAIDLRNFLQQVYSESCFSMPNEYKVDLEWHISDVLHVFVRNEANENLFEKSFRGGPVDEALGYAMQYLINNEVFAYQKTKWVWCVDHKPCDQETWYAKFNGVNQTNPSYAEYKEAALEACKAVPTPAPATPPVLNATDAPTPPTNATGAPTSSTNATDAPTSPTNATNAPTSPAPTSSTNATGVPSGTPHSTDPTTGTGSTQDNADNSWKWKLTVGLLGTGGFLTLLVGGIAARLRGGNGGRDEEMVEHNTKTGSTQERTENSVTGDSPPPYEVAIRGDAAPALNNGRCLVM